MLTKRNNYLDIVKGIAILFIIITHFSWSAQERINYFFPFWIDMAVPIFMIVSGYVYSISFQGKGCNYKIYYKTSEIIKKLVRYILPFTIILIMDTLIEFILHGSSQAALTLFWGCFNGGGGPGGYYYPVILQLVFFFPLIYHIINKYGIFFCFCLNLLYEILKSAYGMNESCYVMLVFRYIFCIGFGCFLAISNRKLNKVYYFFAFVFGSAFILAVSYLGYAPKVITYWSGTSFLAALYVIPIFGFLYNKCPNIKCGMFEIIGKASFNIFLVQKLYYKYADEIITDYILNRELHLLVNILVCTGIGIVFYYMTFPLNRKLLDRIAVFNGSKSSVI